MRKMDINEQRELDYLNREDSHNRFMGLIEFPNIHCVKLANVLCKNEEMVQKYLSEYHSPELEEYEVIDSLHEFKRDILNERTINVDEYRDKIKSCIKIANWSILWVLLQDLFLEYLHREDLDRIIESIHKGLDANDIVKWYSKDKKIIAINNYGVDYIKRI